jgi:hypothetical protein
MSNLLNIFHSHGSFPMTNRINKLRPHLPRKLAVEPLEDRRQMAAFGTPWPDARSLAVSFPSDGAAIGHYSNSLRETLDQTVDRREWQEAVLRAFQSWAVHANINIGLVPDRGDRFGMPGLTTNDPRFGEFRIGAFPQSAVLANASPFQPTAGTWAGDILLNSNTNLFLGDWNSGSPINVPDPNEKGPAIELYSLLLHEAGNALGLPDNQIAGSVMNGNYSGPNGFLKSSDVRALRTLYGLRRDPYEPVANNSRSTATRILHPVGYNRSEPIEIRGSLNTTRDVDFYRITPLRGQETMSIRLWASGISLLKANLEVQDRFGRKIADVKADSIFENNLQIDIGSLRDHSSLFIKVARNSNDVFAIGDYRLDIDYRPTDQQPSLIPPPYDVNDDDDDDPSVDFVSVDELFSSFGLVDREVGTNDRLDQTTPLLQTTGFLAGSRFELTSSISSTADRDLWSFRSPAFTSPKLQIDIAPVGIEKFDAEVYLLNSQGDRIATEATRNADGGVTLVADTPASNTNYVLFIRGDRSSPVTSGNYLVAVDFATTQPENVEQVFTAQLTPEESLHLSRLNVNKTQLFRFDLSANAATNVPGVQLDFYNARTGDVVTSIAAAANSIRTANVWLEAGSYFIKATPLTSTGVALTQPFDFALAIASLSDDQGPNPLDPTNPFPPSNDPIYDWLILDPTAPPAIIDSLEPPLEDPWNSDFFLDYYENFYLTLLG